MTMEPGGPPDGVTDQSEAALADMRTAEGSTVVRLASRHWLATYPGFYQPVNLTARLAASELRRPTARCWGYRAALSDDASSANATMPVYMLDVPDGFGEELLSRNRRSDLRRCRREVEVQRLLDPALLLDQGHAVFESSNRRLGYWRPLSPAAYRRRLERRLRHGRRLFVVGLVDGRLRGYLDAYLVDGILYPEEIHVATDALRTGIGTGLYVETMRIGAAPGSVRTVCNGLHTPEDPDLCRFKESLGFRVVHLPARVVIPRPVLAYIRQRRPATYYRLTGRPARPSRSTP